MSSVNASLASVLLLGACVAEPTQVPDEPIRSVVDRREWPWFVNWQIDLLFVIDSSPGMTAAQTKLAADYRAMIERLGATEIGLPDVHIGVVTTDPRDQGPAAPRCGSRRRDAVRMAARSQLRWSAGRCVRRSRRGRCHGCSGDQAARCDAVETPIARRPQDQQDVESLLLLHAAGMDLGRIREHLRGIGAALALDLTRDLDRLLARLLPNR